MFSALSENLNGIADKLNQFIALAPVVEMKDCSKLLGNLIAINTPARAIGLYEIKNPATDNIMRKFCQSFNIICEGLSKIFFITASPYNDASRSNIVDYRPQNSAALKQLIHYGQLILTGVFKKYDYGSSKANMEHYNTATPPLLNVGNIKLPVAMFVGDHDTFAVPIDTEILRKKLPNVNHFKIYPNMDHSSFSIGKDMSFMKDVITVLRTNNHGGDEELELPII